MDDVQVFFPPYMDLKFAGSSCPLTCTGLVWLTDVEDGLVRTVAESVQPALVAAVDCGPLFVFCLLTSGYLSAVICFTSLRSNLFHHFFFVYSRKDVREHRELCLVYMSLIGENVTSCNIKWTGFLFCSQHDNRRFWKWPRGVLLLWMMHKAERGHDIKTTH